MCLSLCGVNRGVRSPPLACIVRMTIQIEGSSPLHASRPVRARGGAGTPPVDDEVTTDRAAKFDDTVVVSSVGASLADLTRVSTRILNYRLAAADETMSALSASLGGQRRRRPPALQGHTRSNYSHPDAVRLIPASIATRATCCSAGPTDVRRRSYIRPARRHSDPRRPSHGNPSGAVQRCRQQRHHQ
jgi:hypothetical protein